MHRPMGAQAWTTACFGASRLTPVGARAASRQPSSWVPALMTRAATGSRSPRLCALVVRLQEARFCERRCTCSVLVVVM